MFHLAWLGVRHNPARYVATLVAIVTGVAFFSATGFLSDRVIDALQGDVDRQYSSVDAAVIVDDKGAAADFASKLRIAGTAADQIAATEGVDATAGVLTGSVAFRGADGKVFADGATGRLWIEDDDLNPVDVEEGARPRCSGRDRGRQGSREEARPRRRRQGHAAHARRPAGGHDRRDHEVRKLRLDRRERDGLDLEGERVRLALVGSGRVPVALRPRLG